MECILIFGFVIVLSLIINVQGAITIDIKQEANFDENYVVTWGQNHFLKLNRSKEVQLSMDHSSGSGFESKNHYGSGFFQMRIKLPAKDSAGIVTAFYLTSKGNIQDEVDFEFLGNREGKPITIQTNVFTKGQGNREQRFVLWFDPTEDFHAYGILWNPYHIVFYVDNIPIRVKKNNKKGISYPSKPMQVVSSLWNGEAWATDGGKTKINWAYAPFKAHFQGFSESGCHMDGWYDACESSAYWWNTGKYVGVLSVSEQTALKNARAKYMNYDYCSDHTRFSVLPDECQWNQ
ncbi:Xyloglucan endo-transglycosylase C-terminal [Arabidopsis thaliana x Arabidopsis arenosa]|uniref:Xyloglucan endotransglucosylase/hydrolase n=1 Tax=Arabidopsis thaliana x Arabidopsis arenosa TaxID=1240361 RepID=A0A8T1YB29_9BRAS|nr:Xyloglucan endo-transglycosylase C-terminal [Arabidopsis thaliana x Arabidopsis arenosa]